MFNYFAFALFLLVFSALPNPAQTLRANGKIPDDLLITLKTQGAWTGGLWVTTIDANGNFSFQYSGGLPVIIEPALSLNGEKVKQPKYLTSKLSPEDLRALIAEFEKIQFFRFGEDFPPDDEKEAAFITDLGSESISIRINGQNKDVHYDLGDGRKRVRILRELAEKIRGASVWNYENGKIPENLVIGYRISEGDKVRKDIKIDAKGKITENFYRSKFYPETGDSLPVFIKSETVGKLSKRQLQGLINEFEKSVFYAFHYSTLTNYDGCANETNPTTEKRTHINVQINRMTMYASLYENCRAAPETKAAKFEYINGVLTKLFKDLSIIN